MSEPTHNVPEDQQPDTAAPDLKAAPTASEPDLKAAPTAPAVPPTDLRGPPTADAAGSMADAEDASGS